LLQALLLSRSEASRTVESGLACSLVAASPGVLLNLLRPLERQA